MEYKHYTMLSKYSNCTRLPKTKNNYYHNQLLMTKFGRILGLMN